MKNAMGDDFYWIVRSCGTHIFVERQDIPMYVRAFESNKAIAIFKYIADDHTLNEVTQLFISNWIERTAKEWYLEQYGVNGIVDRFFK